ncbi:putative ferric-chelate reductase 1 homolog isoform X2 [Haliotis rufescens]|uniref:putative ferric-chelate reductase 1 homolog isoform X2 n=1 Tax=Haliotis rufescens TaxID=6454 RepID=UPI00201E7A88|nr:putative ferric-chelate reductase 1 homolog isoform X2 [Haliotis rufescens]
MSMSLTVSTTTMRGLFLVCVAAMLLPSVKGNRSGANVGACISMVPSGHGGSTQAFPSPFTIKPASTSYTPGNQINVVLAGVCGRQFKGFLLQARLASGPTTSSGLGTFAATDSNAKTWCPANPSITHVNNDLKSSITVTWTAPSSAQGDIVFVTTFVESFSTYWVQQTSVVIRDESLTNPPPNYPGVPSSVLDASSCASTTPAPPTTKAPEPGRFPKDSSCRSTRGCFHDCDSTGCTFVVGWEDSSDHVKFFIKASFPGASNAWMAIGLSDDQKMGSDGVTECVNFNGQMAVFNSQNTGRSNSKLPTTEAGLLSGSIINGVFSCSFNLTKQGTLDNTLFSLVRERYLLLARGTALSASAISKHDETPFVTTRAANFQRFEELTIGAIPLTLVKAHGSLMVLAWIFAASIGIVIARYYKPQWPESSCLGEKVWFQLHRSFMVLVVLAAVTAFILIFVEVKGWSELGEEASKKAHPILGVIVTVLAVLNPIMALFRPHPNDANRPIFNWAHFGVGTAAHVLAVVTVFLGVNLGKPAVPSYVTWILVGYVVWQVLIEFLLVCFKCQSESKDRSENYELAQKGMPVQQQAQPAKQQGSCLRQGLLLLHIAVITAISTAIIVLIVIS